MKGHIMEKQRNIQLFKAKYDIEACLKEIRECLEIGWTGIGFKTVEFENKWKEYTGYSNAFFTNSATAGLYLSLDILKEENGWDEHCEVITTPITFVSTNHAILKAGLCPVFADVDDTLCLNPDEVVKKITPATKAVMYVGMGGNAGHIDKIINICRDHNLKLILDAAHMSGTRWNQKIVGREADVIINSFQAVKNLPTGDSGMLCFQNDEYDKIARKKAWLGINKDTYLRSSDGGNYKWKYDVEYVGDKYHGNSIMASLAIAQLKHLDDDNEYRRKLASWYEEQLVRLVKEGGIRLIHIPNECISSRHLFQIVVDKRDELVDELNENGIYPGVHYVDNTEYKMYSYAKGTCPVAHYYSEHLVSLPMHLDLNRDDVEYICEIIRGAIV